MNRAYYAGRFSNARHFFFRDPLTLLTELQAIGIGFPRAFHCAGPCLMPTVSIPYIDPRLFGIDVQQYEADYQTGISGHWTGD